jgi:nickel/cobalt transporter (NiCoT) family protein
VTARVRRIRGALTRAEWARVGAMAVVVGGLHVVGFGLLFGVVVPAHLAMGTAGAFTAGVGLTAYTLGLRHALDADHIAAIDNTTRKLMGDGRRPLAVGLFFSLGHSTVVFVLALLLGLGVRSVAGPVGAPGSALHRIAGIVGPSVSGTFLLLIAAVNAAALAGIVGAFRGARTGRMSSDEVAARAVAGGPASRVLGRFTRAVTRSWQMYPLGVLFGLGFDTATEIALLFLAGGAAGAGLPWYAVLTLPILFAAGMSLLDTIDGSFMNFAYGWAFANPVRKLYYNATVTGLSVVVALGIGGIELAGVLADRLGLRGGVWDAASAVDLNAVGYAVVALFAVTWAGAVLVWRLGRLEERWALPAPAEGG